MISPWPLAIVGGGPSGVAAAIEAARCGLDTALIDEAPSGARASRLVGRDAELRVRQFPGTAVLKVSRGRELLWARGEISGTWRVERLLLATGGYPRAIPFPGWTLPGVRIADVPTDLRTGPRAIVAGTGPRLLAAARRLLDLGATVVAVLDAAAPSQGPEPTEEAAEAREHLRGAGVPVLFEHAVFEARGRGAVEGVVYGPVDPRDWAPRLDESTDAAVDLVLIDFGDVARDELAVLAGCGSRYDPATNAWVPARDELMRTTVAGVYAAGVGAGVAWSLAAADEGRVAAITAAEDAGTISPDEAAARREGPLRRLRALAATRAAIEERSRIRPGLLALAKPDTVVCRCEGVALGALRAACEQGVRDLSSIKLLTRLGMGDCQGRECGPAAGMLLGRATGEAPEVTGRINPRPPIRPVTLGALARMEIAPQPGEAP